MESKNEITPQNAVLRLIELAGGTKYRIAQNAGVAPQQITEWISGRRNITLNSFINLCQSNGIEPSEALKGYNEKTIQL